MLNVDLEKAVLEEREACAKIAEGYCRCNPIWANYKKRDPACDAHDIADDIRSGLR